MQTANPTRDVRLSSEAGEWVSQSPQAGDAQELVRAAFLKAHHKLDELRDTARFSTWLVCIVLNEVFMKLQMLGGSRKGHTEAGLIEIEEGSE